MTHPTPDQIDASVFDGKAPPADFINQHYSIEEMADALGISMDQLFLLVRDGVVPRPVFLPTHPPLACWNTAIVRAWVEAGSPPDPNHEMHKQIVFETLCETLRDNLSASPPTINERN